MTSLLLPAYDGPRLPAEELVALVDRVAARPGTWRPHVRFDVGSRHWSRLDAPDGVDLWLLTWLPDQATELHDHGRSTAAYTVLSGAVDEVRPTRTRSQRTGRLRTTRLDAGQTRWLPPGAIHDIRGSTAGPAVSLHAYSPPLTTMTWYDSALTPVRTELTNQPEG